ATRRAPPSSIGSASSACARSPPSTAAAPGRCSRSWSRRCRSRRTARSPRATRTRATWRWSAARTSGRARSWTRWAAAEPVVVSEEAGTTRDAIDVVLEREQGSYVLVDTAGLRRPGRQDRVGERLSALVALRSIERAEVALLVSDASQGFTEQDVHLAGLVR